MSTWRGSERSRSQEGVVLTGHPLSFGRQTCQIRGFLLHDYQISTASSNFGCINSNLFPVRGCIILEQWTNIIRPSVAFSGVYTERRINIFECVFYINTAIIFLDRMVTESWWSSKDSCAILMNAFSWRKKNSWKQIISNFHTNSAQWMNWMNENEERSTWNRVKVSSITAYQGFKERKAEWVGFNCKVES